MGVAKTSPVPEHCPECGRDTPTTIDLNKAGQMEAICQICRHRKFGKALSGRVAGAMQEREDKFLSGPNAQEVYRPDAPAPSNVVSFPTGRPGGRPAAVQAPALSAGSLVEAARAEVARLAVEIPEVEGQLAGKKAHLRGLQKMIAAYERANPRVGTRVPVPVPTFDPAVSRAFAAEVEGAVDKAVAADVAVLSQLEAAPAAAQVERDVADPGPPLPVEPAPPARRRRRA